MLDPRFRALLRHPIAISAAYPFLLVQLVGVGAQGTRSVLQASGMAISSSLFSTLYGAIEILVALAYAAVLRRMLGYRLGVRVRGAAKTLLYLIPVLYLLFIQFMEVRGSTEHLLSQPMRVFSCAAVALGAGLFEEVAWRYGSLSAGMRCWMDKPWHVDALLLLSSFSFGLTHFANLLHGADFSYTLVQVFYTTGLGYTMGAAYLRTRNLPMLVLMHAAIDFQSLLASGTEVVQAINMSASADVVFLLVRLGLIMLVWGMICARPKVRPQIEDVWLKDELGRQEMAEAEIELAERLRDVRVPTEGDAMDGSNNFEKVRRRYRFVGQVQGVGFRFTISSIAHKVGATGWVMNEPDGSVTAEVQGNDEQVAAVIQGLTQHFNTGRRWFSGFTIDDVRDVETVRGERDFHPIY